MKYILKKGLRARTHWILCLATGGRVFVANPSTLGRHVAATAKFPLPASKVSYPTEWLPHATRTIASVLAAERRKQPQKRSFCGGDEPQPVAHLRHKLQCARQSMKIMVSYTGINISATKTRPPVAKQSGQCIRALIVSEFIYSIDSLIRFTNYRYFENNEY